MKIEDNKGRVVKTFSIVDEESSFSNEELSFKDILKDTEVVIMCTVVKPWKDGDLEDIREDNGYIVYIPSICEARLVNEKLIEEVKMK